MSAKLSHDDLMRDLASHLKANGERMVWCDTQLGSSGSPRPDVFAVDKSFAQFSAVAYECKVSVSDLRSDVTSGKWQKYRQYCHAVWFAMPRGLASLDLVPAECGVILRSDAGWRAARRPVKRVIDSIPVEAWLKLLMTSDWASREPRPRSGAEWALEAIARKRFGDELGEMLRDRDRARVRTEEAKRMSEEAMQRARADVSERREKAEADARLWSENFKYRLSSAQRQLADALGLPVDAEPDDLVRAMRSLSATLEGRQVERAIEQLQSIQAVLTANQMAEAA